MTARPDLVTVDILFRYEDIIGFNQVITSDKDEANLKSRIVENIMNDLPSFVSMLMDTFEYLDEPELLGELIDPETINVSIAYKHAETKKLLRNIDVGLNDDVIENIVSMISPDDKHSKLPNGAYINLSFDLITDIPFFEDMDTLEEVADHISESIHVMRWEITNTLFQNDYLVENASIYDTRVTKSKNNL
jgi:hypothetical protein